MLFIKNGIMKINQNQKVFLRIIVNLIIVMNISKKYYLMKIKI